MNLYFLDYLIVIIIVSTCSGPSYEHEKRVERIEQRVTSLTSGRFELREVEKGQFAQCRVLPDSLRGVK